MNEAIPDNSRLLISEALREQLALDGEKVVDDELTSAAKNSVIVVLVFGGYKPDVHIVGTLTGLMADTNAFEVELRLSLNDGLWMLEQATSNSFVYFARNVHVHLGEEVTEFTFKDHGFAVRLHGIDFSRQMCSAIVNLRPRA